MKHQLALAAVALLYAFPAAATLPPTAGIVEVRDASDPRSTTPSLGFLADAEGHVIAPVRKDADVLLVRLVDGTEYRADSVHFDAHSGLGLLALKIAAPPDSSASYAFARDVVELGRKVYGAVRDAGTGEVRFISGGVARIDASGSHTVPDTIAHSALVGRHDYGSPLLNNCGEVVGVILDLSHSKDPSVSSGDNGEREYGWAIPAEWLARAFTRHGLQPQMSDQICLSEAAQVQEAKNTARQLEEEREEADRARKEAEKEAEEADQARKEAEKEAEEADQARKDAEKEAEEAASKASTEEEARKQAEEKSKEAEAAAVEARKKAQDKQEKIRFWAIIAGAGLALLLLLIGVAHRRSINQAKRNEGKAESELAEHLEKEERIQDLPNVLLNGEDASGERFVLRIPKNSLAEGAVVGRSPKQSGFVINHGEVSRQHFRLFSEGGSVMVEDMGSTNGTGVDGIVLAQGKSTALQNGARLTLGNLSLMVELE